MTDCRPSTSNKINVPSESAEHEIAMWCRLMLWVCMTTAVAGTGTNGMTAAASFQGATPPPADFDCKVNPNSRIPSSLRCNDCCVSPPPTRLRWTRVADAGTGGLLRAADSARHHSRQVGCLVILSVGWCSEYCHCWSRESAELPLV